MKGAIFLILTIVAESTAIIFMKLSNGLEHKFQAFLAGVAYLLGFLFLTLALKYIPAGIANAIWAGASTVLVAALGIWLFNEELSAPQWFFLLLVVIGIAGLSLSR